LDEIDTKAEIEKKRNYLNFGILKALKLNDYVAACRQRLHQGRYYVYYYLYVDSFYLCIIGWSELINYAEIRYSNNKQQRPYCAKLGNFLIISCDESSS
jgi:hypothetical protein